MNITDFLSHLRGVKRAGIGWSVRDFEKRYYHGRDLTVNSLPGGNK